MTAKTELMEDAVTCSVQVESNQVMTDIARETADWLQNYFATGLAGDLPTICVLSDPKLGK